MGGKCTIFMFQMGMQKLLLALLKSENIKTKTSNNLSRVLNCMYHFALLLFALLPLRPLVLSQIILALARQRVVRGLMRRAKSMVHLVRIFLLRADR